MSKTKEGAIEAEMADKERRRIFFEQNETQINEFLEGVLKEKDIFPWNGMAYNAMTSIIEDFKQKFL